MLKVQENISIYILYKINKKRKKKRDSTEDDANCTFSTERFRKPHTATRMGGSHINFVVDVWCASAQQNQERNKS